MSRVLEPGAVLYYETLLNGVSVVQAWAVYHGPIKRDAPDARSPAVVHRLEFLQQVDQDALGYGGGKVRVRAILECGESFEPYRYLVESRGSQLRIDFVSGRFVASLPATPDVEGTTGTADFLLGGNMMPQLAIKVRLLHESVALPFAGAFFSPETLQDVPYALEGQPPFLRSSLGESVRLTGDGWIESVEMEGGDVVVRSAKRPLPAWRNRALVAMRPLQYAAPVRTGIQLEDVRIPGPDVEIGATLSLPPAGTEAVAAVLFLGGSGRFDRHGMTAEVDLGYHTIMDRLATRGIVGLRYDKRGAGSTEPGSERLDPSFEAVIRDACAAMEWLGRHDAHRALPLFIVGHSQGGLVALALAAKERRVSGVVLLATAGRPLDEILADQTLGQARELGLSAESVNEHLASLRELFKAVRSVDEWTPDNVPPRVYASRFMQRFYREQLAYDPAALASRLHCPVLVVQGDRDVQVFEKDAQILYEAASAAGVSAECRLLRGYDHLFMRVRGKGGVRAYHDRRRRVAAVLPDTIGEWIRAVLGAPRR
jgi:pimeloyl-ACP methyl ester carboxylesterase